MNENYYHTRESVDEYIELAKDVNGRELIDKLKRVLPSNSTILEIGTGPGTDWKILRKSFQVIGSDNSPLFVNHLRRNNPSGKFIELDAITIKTRMKFDGIYSNKVLHHLGDNELIDSIKRQNKILKTGGIICHSFWKGEGSEVFKGLYVNYQTENTLRDVFKDYFEVLSINYYNEFEDSDSLLIIGKRKNAL